MTDQVNKPAHYTQGGIECIAAIEASMPAAEFRGFLKGNVSKYLWRYANKGKASQDLAKAEWYLKLLRERIDAQEKAEAVLAALKDMGGAPSVLRSPGAVEPVYGPGIASGGKAFAQGGVVRKDGPYHLMGEGGPAECVPVEKAQSLLRPASPPPLYKPRGFP